MQPGAVVIVFVMKGCGACEEYLPRLKQLMKQHQFTVQLFVLDVSDPNNTDIGYHADRFRIQATPTTIIARRNGGYQSFEGSLNERETLNVLRHAQGLV